MLAAEKSVDWCVSGTDVRMASKQVFVPIYTDQPTERFPTCVHYLHSRRSSTRCLSACFPQLGAFIMGEVAAGIRILQHEPHVFQCMDL